MGGGEIAMTTTDITIDGVKFFAEFNLLDNGRSTISLTEVCEKPDDNEPHTHIVYDFKEIE